MSPPVTIVWLSDFTITGRVVKCCIKYFFVTFLLISLLLVGFNEEQQCQIVDNQVEPTWDDKWDDMFFLFDS